jgi:hypothetical protein
LDAAETVRSVRVRHLFLLQENNDDWRDDKADFGSRRLRGQAAYVDDRQQKPLLGMYPRG